MILKPGDLFFGLTEFLAFILPGFIFCATLPAVAGFSVPDFLNITIKDSTSFAWFSFIMASYVSGHFIHHVCAMILNPIYKISYRRWKLRKHEKFITKSEAVVNGKFPLQVDNLKAAEAYLKVNHPETIPELEKHHANSKLFRSLCLLSLYLCFLPDLNCTIVISLIIISVFSFVRFANQRWNHGYLIYQYFLITID